MPNELWDAASKLRSAFKAKRCMAAEIWPGSCKGSIVQAHTVPHSSSLEKIARDGHVYQFVASMDALVRGAGTSPEPRLLGISKASVFHGFCQKHDQDLFAPLEREAFTCRPDQCLLLAYRALSFELYNKSAAIAAIKAVKGAAPFLSTYVAGAGAAIADLTSVRTTLENSIKAQDWSRVRALAIELESAPPVMCSGGFNPENDFDGEFLQDMSDLDAMANLMTLSSFSSGSAGFVVLAWLAEHDEVCSRFAASLDKMQGIDLTRALVAMFYEYCGNLQVQPDWWDSLSSDARAMLCDKMWTSMNPLLASGRDELHVDLDVFAL